MEDISDIVGCASRDTFSFLSHFDGFVASHLYSWWQAALRNNRIILFGALTKQNQQSTEN